MFRFKKRTVDEFVGAILAIFLISVSFLCVRAAQVTGVNDTMSRGKVAMASNHDLSFVTPSGAGEGSTMTVTFPAGFGTSGMTAGDVDLFDNGLPVSTAPDCSGTEQAAAVWLGNTLSFQICPGDGGAFAPGSTVTIVIGTDAIDYGVGVNRVINPAAAGAYRLAIGGSFGDSGFAPVSVALDDSVDVTACIGDACNIAPPPPPPPVVIEPKIGGSTGPEQTPPPQISGVTIDQITVTTARISWHTDIASNSYVRYGSSALYDQIYGANDNVTDHSVVLIGLKPGTEYYLAARSMDVFGNVEISSENTFTTLSVKTAVLPQITDIILESVGGTDATITWKTDMPTYWEIDFGRTNNYGNEVNNGAFDTTHSAALGNLSPDTAYHFRILAIDANGDQAYSSDQSFMTFDTIPPAIFLLHVEFITPNSADIVWQTNKPATGGVKYGVSEAYENGEIIESAGYTNVHRVSLSGLSAGTSYHVKVFQTDQSGNDSQSGDTTFLTASILSAPMAARTNLPPLPIVPQKNLVAIGSEALPVTVNGVPTEIVANILSTVIEGTIGIELPDALTAKTLKEAVLQVGSDTYEFAQGPDGIYRVFFAAPPAPGTVPAVVRLEYADGTAAYAKWNINIAAPGTVYEIINGKNVPVPGARVTVLKNGVPWNGAQYGQNGVDQTKANGEYSIFVPKDNYSLKIEKNGYATKIIELTQTPGPVSVQIQINKEVIKGSILSKKALDLAKHTVSQPACIFPWALLLLIIGYIMRRYFKQKVGSKGGGRTISKN
jgi:hypothetical protein